MTKKSLYSGCVLDDEYNIIYSITEYSKIKCHQTDLTQINSTPHLSVYIISTQCQHVLYVAFRVCNISIQCDIHNIVIMVQSLFYTVQS